MSRKIPEGWTCKSLGELFDFKNGFNAEKAMYGKGKKFVNIMEVINNQSLYKKDISGQVDISDASFSLYSVVKGDVLFNRTSETPEEIGLTAVYLDDDPVTFGGFVIRARPIGRDLVQDFCKYCFSADMVRKEIVKRGQGAIRANIGQGDLSEVRLQIPSKAEQERIIKILSTWDESIAKLGDLALAKQKRKSFYISRALSPNQSGWRLKRLDEITDLISDGTHFSPKSKNGPYKYITSKNIRFGRMDLSDVSYISEEEHRSIYKRCPVQYGDLLLTKDGANTGNAALNELAEEFSLLSSVAVIRANVKQTSNNFLLQTLLSPQYQAKIKDAVAGQAITRLTLQKIKAFEIILPSKNRQEEITKIFVLMDREIRAIQKGIDLLVLQKQAIMQQLLAGKKRLAV